MDANLLEMAMRLKSVQRQEALEHCGINEEEAYSKETLMNIRRACVMKSHFSGVMLSSWQGLRWTFWSRRVSIRQTATGDS